MSVTLAYGELLEQLAAHSPTLRHVCNSTLYPAVKYSSASLATYADNSDNFAAQLTCVLVRLALMTQLSVLDIAVVVCWVGVSVLVFALPYVFVAAVCVTVITLVGEAGDLVYRWRARRT